MGGTGGGPNRAGICDPRWDLSGSRQTISDLTVREQRDRNKLWNNFCMRVEVQFPRVVVDEESREDVIIIPRRIPHHHIIIFMPLRRAIYSPPLLTPHPSLPIQLVPSPHPCPAVCNASCPSISRSSCSPRSSTDGPDYFSDSSPPAASLSSSSPAHYHPSACLFILINPNLLLSLNHNILSFLFCLSA